MQTSGQYRKDFTEGEYDGIQKTRGLKTLELLIKSGIIWVPAALLAAEYWGLGM